MFSLDFCSPWPDPNSPVLEKVDFGVPLVELLKWLDVRDTLLGENFKRQDITAALALARDCTHPDAVWLTSIFDGKEVSTKEEARNVLFSFQNDALALCFAWHLSNAGERRLDLSLLHRSVEMGCAFACSSLFTQIGYETRKKHFHLVQSAVKQHERDGFNYLGWCLSYGVGCKSDMELAKRNFLISAELGCVEAALNLGSTASADDPDCWMWRTRAALIGSPFLFLDFFSTSVEQFVAGSGNNTVMFLIGRALKGSINYEKKEIFGEQSSFQLFGDDIGFDDWVGPAKQAVSFYDSQVKSARLAVDTWTLIGIRNGVVKDIRKLIGKMIWEGRFEAKYKI